MAYLAFVLSLTLSCYCSGLFVMCKNHKSSKNYADQPKEEEDVDESFLTDTDDGMLNIICNLL